MSSFEIRTGYIGSEQDSPVFASDDSTSFPARDLAERVHQAAQAASSSDDSSSSSSSLAGSSAKRASESPLRARTRTRTEEVIDEAEPTDLMKQVRQLQEENRQL